MQPISVLKLFLLYQLILPFSWDDMGKYDIPAMIDHILKVTKQDQIFYVGHSMGTTGFMVMANERPEYQDKIYLASFLAPVAFVDHMKAPIKFLAPFSNQIGVSTKLHSELRILGY